MKTKTKKDFDAVKFAREQKKDLSAKLSNMTNDEIIDYFKKIKRVSKIKPNA